MILAIDVGNTNIVIGCMNEKEIFFIERISTNRTKTELEYAVDIRTVLDIYKIRPDAIDGCIISSVVPPITNTLKLAVEKCCGHSPLILGPGLKTGLNIKLDNPTEMGADRVADAVAAMNEYPLPVVIVDMGTATTISVIDKNRQFIGGMIMPGIRVSLDALASRASQLNGVSIEEPKRIIGKNTIDCMKSGLIYGNASAIDGLLERIEEELGEPISIVATGGLCQRVIPHCKHDITIDGNLLLKGLRIIYNKNKNTEEK